MDDIVDDLIEIDGERPVYDSDQATPVNPVITINLPHEFYGRMQLTMQHNRTGIPQ